MFPEGLKWVNYFISFNVSISLLQECLTRRGMHPRPTALLPFFSAPVALFDGQKTRKKGNIFRWQNLGQFRIDNSFIHSIHCKVMLQFLLYPACWRMKVLVGDCYVLFSLLFFSGWLFFESYPAFHPKLNIGYIKGNQVYHIGHKFHDYIVTNLGLKKKNANDIGPLDQDGNEKSWI